MKPLHEAAWAGPGNGLAQSLAAGTVQTELFVNVALLRRSKMSSTSGVEQNSVDLLLGI
jgi:hypothetical protein